MPKKVVEINGKKYFIEEADEVQTPQRPDDKKERGVIDAASDFGRDAIDFVNDIMPWNWIIIFAVLCCFAGCGTVTPDQHDNSMFLFSILIQWTILIVIIVGAFCLMLLMIWGVISDTILGKALSQAMRDILQAKERE